MSKRDNLRNLRMSQKPINTGDTPAEEYSKLAAEASNSNFDKSSDKNTEESTKIEIRANKDVKIPTPDNKSDDVTPADPAKVGNDIQNPIETLKNDTKITIETENLPELEKDSFYSKPEMVDLSSEPVKNEENRPSVKVEEDVSLPIEETSNTSANIPEEINLPKEDDDSLPVKPVMIRKTKTNFKSVAQEPGKRISVSLKIENNNWMRRTAMRCGLSIQDYVNILLDEAWAREKRSPFVLKDTDPLPERLSSNKTVLVAIKLTEDNINRSKRLRASHCMTMTSYMNFLIQEEQKREEKYGMRAAIFDED